MFYNHKNCISFRKIEESDLSELKNLKDESWFGTVNTACLNMADQKHWFNKISEDKSSLFFSCYAPVSLQLPVGLFGITNIDTISHSCEFTHSLFASMRGKGWGKLTLEAGIDMTFEMFNIHRVETWILSNNMAETKGVQSVGFIEEGRKRSAVYKCGNYLDCILFGLLREEWSSTGRVKEMKGCCNLSYVPKDGNK